MSTLDTVEGQPYFELGQGTVAYLHTALCSYI